MSLNKISFDNLSVNFNDTMATINLPNSEFFPPFPRVLFGTVDSSVPYIVNAAINVALAIPTAAGNLLILLAMRHVTSIHLPSKLLLCSLVLTDLGVGLVLEPQFAAFLFVSTLSQYIGVIQCSLRKSLHAAAALLTAVSLLTMTAISLDRYTALFFHLRYQQIVTTRRVCAVLIFFWSFSLFCAWTWLWNNALGRTVVMTVYPTCFLVISVAYSKIFRRLGGQHSHQVHPQAHVQAQQQAGSTFNMARYKRTASAMLWVYALFILCYMPFFCMSVVVIFFEHTALTQCIWQIAYTIVLLNSCLNPFVYCLRLPEIRAEVLKQLRKLFCRSPQQ